MATFAFYKFELHDGGRSLFYKDTNIKAIEKANDIVRDELTDGMIIIGKKKNQDQSLNSSKRIERNNVIIWELCDNKELSQYEGHKSSTIESHPGCYIIFDNRPDVCQIAIEKNSNAFEGDTDKVARFLSNSFNNKLTDYGLCMTIKQKHSAKNFKERVQERLLKDHDSVKKIVWEFPNPKKVQGIDASQSLKNRLEYLSLFAQATNALKGKLELSGSKGNPMVVDDEEVEDLAGMIALCAQNHYNLSYYFHNSPVVSFKKASIACFSIEDYVIRDFRETGGQFVTNTDEEGGSEQEPKYELFDKLDEIRVHIADYNEKDIND